MSLETVSVSKGWIIFTMAISFFVIWIYLHIVNLIYQKILKKSSANLSQEQKNEKSLLKIVVLIWIAIIIHEVMQYGVLNCFLIPKISECADGNGQCGYCDVFGRFDNILLLSKSVFILLFLIQTLRYTSNLSHCQLLALQIWVLLTFIGLCIGFLSQTEYVVKRVKSDTGSDLLLCLHNPPRIRPLFAIIRTMMLLTGLFAVSLYIRMTWKQIKSIEFYKQSDVETIEKTMTTAIKYCILCIQLLFVDTILKLIIWRLTTPNLPYRVHPIMELLDGLCLYMLFDFGENKYIVLYGWIHFKVLNYWKERHRVAIEIMKTEREQKKTMYKERHRRRKRKKRQRKGSRDRSNSFEPSLGSIEENTPSELSGQETEQEREELEQIVVDISP